MTPEPGEIDKSKGEIYQNAERGRKLEEVVRELTCITEALNRLAIESGVLPKNKKLNLCGFVQESGGKYIHPMFREAVAETGSSLDNGRVWVAGGKDLKEMYKVTEHVGADNTHITVDWGGVASGRSYAISEDKLDFTDTSGNSYMLTRVLRPNDNLDLTVKGVFGFRGDELPTIENLDLFLMGLNRAGGISAETSTPEQNTRLV